MFPNPGFVSIPFFLLIMSMHHQKKCITCKQDNPSLACPKQMEVFHKTGRVIPHCGAVYCSKECADVDALSHAFICVKTYRSNGDDDDDDYSKRRNTGPVVWSITTVLDFIDDKLTNDRDRNKFLNKLDKKVTETVCDNAHFVQYTDLFPANYSAHWSPEDRKEYTKQCRFHTFIFERKPNSVQQILDNLIGVTSIYLVTHEEDDPRFQNQYNRTSIYNIDYFCATGYGSIVMDVLKNLPRFRDATRITLQSVVTAVRFYAQNGFVFSKDVEDDEAANLARCDTRSLLAILQDGSEAATEFWRDVSIDILTEGPRWSAKTEDYPATDMLKNIQERWADREGLYPMELDLHDVDPADTVI